MARQMACYLELHAIPARCPQRTRPLISEPVAIQVKSLKVGELP
eukprot:CAMPEP_0196735426 /NCGR_PEP_ID=MMETSP1091-20130531/13884_1 /TAXON_ID=302021 /ORGANISM="Rhodomonas sp., Strain CCMP768" /LENGTH=43 /DNA_ID= /DNA_START= /DNA_END= /DNA_ORIENTATION=